MEGGEREVTGVRRVRTAGPTGAESTNRVWSRTLSRGRHPCIVGARVNGSELPLSTPRLQIEFLVWKKRSGTMQGESASMNFTNRFWL
jgi:hypothetical protein